MLYLTLPEWDKKKTSKYKMWMKVLKWFSGNRFSMNHQVLPKWLLKLTHYKAACFVWETWFFSHRFQLCFKDTWNNWMTNQSESKTSGTLMRGRKDLYKNVIKSQAKMETVYINLIILVWTCNSRIFAEVIFPLTTLSIQMLWAEKKTHLHASESKIINLMNLHLKLASQ